MYDSIENYFNWLLGMIDADNYGFYWKVLGLLFERPFYSNVACDDNRAADGLELRYKFCNEAGGATLFMMSSCSILEMMVALADRIEYDNMHDSDLGDRTPLWFWGMIDNLGLSDFDDYHFDEECVNRIVDNFLERRYDRDGAGGLFTIHNPHINMRREEIWYQAQYFLEENFD